MRITPRTPVLRDLMPILAIATVVGVTLVGVPPAQAQSLDDVLAGLLQNQCEGLLGNTGFAGSIGENLAAICGLQFGSGTSSGGGAAAVQTSTSSILTSHLQSRLDRTRREQQEALGNASLSLDGRFRRGGPDSRSLNASGSGGSGSEPGSRWGLFFSGNGESLDRNRTAFEDGYDSTVVGGTFGIDYSFGDKVVGGLLVGYSKQDGDFNLGGQHEMTSVDPTLFVSIVPSPRTFVQIVAGLRAQDYDVDRLVTFQIDDGNEVIDELDCGGPCLARSNTDADVLTGGIQFGYDRASGAFTYGPRLGLNYSDTTVDAYAETGNSGLEMIVRERDVQSVQSTLGFYGSWAVSRSSGVFLPQFSVEWVHEFEDDPNLLTAQLVDDLQADPVVFSFQTNEAESDFVNAEVGAVWVLTNGIQPYVNLGAMLGNSTFDSFSGSVGVRFEL